MTTTVVTLTLAAAMNGCGATGVPTAAPATSHPAPVTFAPLPQPQYRPLSQQELAELLLDVSDLPSNYIPAPKTTPNWLDRPFCADPPPHPPITASASYRKDGGPPDAVARIGIRQWPTTTQAASSFEALAAAVRNCPGETVGGRRYRYEPAPLPAGNMYRTVAVRVSGNGTTTLQGFATLGPAVFTIEIGELMPPEQMKDGMSGATHDGSRLVQLIEKQIVDYQGPSSGWNR